MYHQKCAEQVFYAKDGDAINSPVNCKTFLLITQLVCQFGVPQKHVSKVIVTVMQSAGVEPRNFHTVTITLETCFWGTPN